MSQWWRYEALPSTRIADRESTSAGLGKTFVETYLARPGVTVIAVVRDPKASTSKALETLPKGKGSQILLVKIDSAVQEDPAAAVKDIEAAGITHIDTVIANAGISDDFTPVTKVSIDAFRRHMDVNGYGTLYLIQAVYGLLAKSKNPKFVAVGSALGSISGMEQRAQTPCAAYGPSKAVVHWLVRKLHFENPELISFCADPG